MGMGDSTGMDLSNNTDCHCDWRTYVETPHRKGDRVMSDYISRQAAIDAMTEFYKDLLGDEEPKLDERTALYVDLKLLVERLPSAQPERKSGKWILVKGSNGKDYHKCSKCLHTQDITGVKNYCAVCGADMRGEQDDRH